MSTGLPTSFKDLEAWIGWALPTMAERSSRRSTSNMVDLQAFYDAILPRLEAVLKYLGGIGVGDNDPKNQNLLNLTKALAEIAPAVELFHEPTISYGYDVARFRVDPE